MFRQIKDLSGVVAASPEMVDQSRSLSSAVQAPSPAIQVRMAPVVQSGPAAGPDFEPIAGVSLELYAEISKSLATVNYDKTKAPEMAAAKGVVAADWQSAMDGWNARMMANQSVAKRFNALHTGPA